ncbi:DUF2752 domain-containing protein [Xylanibacter caecicola]|uniref:DUF2752 domain-containing protein n=1 Tax=Xylanibacter caecicola TaxID=2736294 RepID=UPI00333C8CE4
MLYHIPCPGCGITRATILSLKGQFLNAFLFNPNVVLGLIYLFGYPILVILSLITHEHLIISLYHDINNIFKTKVGLLSILLFELFIWASNIYRGI